MQSGNKPLPYLASVDPDFCHHMTSLVLNVLKKVEYSSYLNAA